MARHNQVHAAKKRLVGDAGTAAPKTCKTAFSRVNHEKDIVGHMVGHMGQPSDIVSEALSFHQLNIKEICKPSRCKVCWLDSKGLRTIHAELCVSRRPYCSCSTRSPLVGDFIMRGSCCGSRTRWRCGGESKAPSLIARGTCNQYGTECIRMYRYK